MMYVVCWCWCDAVSNDLSVTLFVWYLWCCLAVLVAFVPTRCWFGLLRGVVGCLCWPLFCIAYWCCLLIIVVVC